MSKLWVQNNAANNPQIIYQEADPTGNGINFDDLTSSIEAWSNYGSRILQYETVRKHIKTLVATITAMFTNWGALTTEEQQIASDWICAPYALRLSVNTDEQDWENWKYVVLKTRGLNSIEDLKGRQLITELLREQASDPLRTEAWTYDESNQFFYDTLVFIQGYEFANAQDLIWWICNKVGTPYENDGFAQKPYYIESLRDKLEAIYMAEY